MKWLKEVSYNIYTSTYRFGKTSSHQTSTMNIMMGLIAFFGIPIMVLIILVNEIFSFSHFNPEEFEVFYLSVFFLSFVPLFISSFLVKKFNLLPVKIEYDNALSFSRKKKLLYVFVPPLMFYMFILLIIFYGVTLG